MTNNNQPINISDIQIFDGIVRFNNFKSRTCLRLDRVEGLYSDYGGYADTPNGRADYPDLRSKTDSEQS